MIDDILGRNKAKKVTIAITEVYQNPQRKGSDLHEGDVTLPEAVRSLHDIRIGDVVVIKNEQKNKKAAPKELVGGKSRSQSGFFITIGLGLREKLGLEEAGKRETDEFGIVYGPVSIVEIRRK